MMRGNISPVCNYVFGVEEKRARIFLVLSSLLICETSKRQWTQLRTQKIPMRCKEVISFQPWGWSDPGTNFPERLWKFHSWKYLKSNSSIPYTKKHEPNFSTIKGIISQNYDTGGTSVEKSHMLLLIQLSSTENKASVASDFLLLYKSTT